MIKVSDVSKTVQPSLTRALFNMAKNYSDVIDFTLGDPDVQTHQAIKDAGCAAIQAGIMCRWSISATPRLLS